MTNAELDDRLSELLIGYEVVSADVVARARAYQSAKANTLAGALTGLHLVPEEVVSSLLQELTGVQAVDPSLMTVYPDFIDRMSVLVPPSLVGRLLVFPAQAEVNALHVCMLNPTDGWTARALESVSGCRVVPNVAHEASLVQALDQHYGRLGIGPARYVPGGQDAAEAAYRALLDVAFDDYAARATTLVNRHRDALVRDETAVAGIIRDPAIIRLVQQLLCRAVEAGASDIHIESMDDRLRVRIRVDGAMRTAHLLPGNMALPVVARLKAMAELPIGRSDGPLDARIGSEIAWGRAIDLRLSLVPSVTGDKVVLRVLDRTRERRVLADLGIDPVSQAAIEEAADLPNGLLLVTGPTGSGKSSTLYALLDRLNNEATCILTAEDPVESRVSGVTQVHCQEQGSLTFASALRSFLRQDPDVIMVGEIRDAETADIALKAALTGHIVLSTLHTNDAPGAVLRLVNMNLEPFLISSALRLVVAQRLIRRLCRACRVRLEPGTDLWAARVASMPEDLASSLAGVAFYEPHGCLTCAGTGYRGRTGIFEVMRVTETLEPLIVARENAATVRAQARREGMRTLRDAALQKVVSGETSIAEVLEHTVSHLAGLPAPGFTAHA